MAKCLERLGDSFNKIRLDARAVKPIPPDALVKTDFGVITPETQFVSGRRGTLGFKYKAWTRRNGIEWVSKGNNPILYERKFLNTLKPSDFTGIQDLTGKGVVGAAEAEGVIATKEAVLKTLQEAGITEVAGVPVDTFVEQVGVARKTSNVLTTDVTKKVWQNVPIRPKQQLTGGRQRTVWFEEESGGARKFVKKIGGDVDGAKVELMYSNLSEELGMNIVPKIAQYNPKSTFEMFLRQEFVDAPTAFKYGDNGRLLLRKFVVNTKQGRDWNFIDYLFHQVDRNNGNFVYNIGKKGNIVDFRLIDNNGGLGPHTIVPDFAKSSLNMPLPKATADSYKTWLKSMGWDEKVASSWSNVEASVTDYFAKHNMDVAKDKFYQGQIDKFLGRMKAVVDADFHVPIGRGTVKQFVRQEALTAEEIAKGTARIDRVAKRSVTDIAIKNPNKVFAEEISDKPLKRVKSLSGGRQRKVTLKETPSGKKLVVKEDQFPRPGSIGMNNEILFSDFAHEMGIQVVPKITKTAVTTLAQEFTTYPIRTSIKVADDVMRNQLNTFITTTKPGKDWGFMDALFGAFDRHGGNYALKMERGKIVDVRLIDNNDLNFRAVSADTKQVAMDQLTKEKLKKWLGDRGWSETAPNWGEVSKNIRAYLGERGIVDLPGAADFPGDFISGIQSVVTNGFKFPTKK